MRVNASASGAAGAARDSQDGAQPRPWRSASAAVIRALKLKAVRRRPTRPAPRGDASEPSDPSRAAIASSLAAEIYGLDILTPNIEDARHNTTRFVVLPRKPDHAEPGDGPVITTFVFRVRNVPAALYKALGGFATNGVNMTKLRVLSARRLVQRHHVLCRYRGPPEASAPSSSRWKSSPSSPARCGSSAPIRRARSAPA